MGMMVWEAPHWDGEDDWVCFLFGELAVKQRAPGEVNKGAHFPRPPKATTGESSSSGKMTLSLDQCFQWRWNVSHTGNFNLSWRLH